MWDVGGVGGCLGDGAPAHAVAVGRRGPVVLEGHAVALAHPEVFFGAVGRLGARLGLRARPARRVQNDLLVLKDLTYHRASGLGSGKRGVTGQLRVA